MNGHLVLLGGGNNHLRWSAYVILGGVPPFSYRKNTLSQGFEDIYSFLYFKIVYS